MLAVNLPQLEAVEIFLLAKRTLSRYSYTAMRILFFFCFFVSLLQAKQNAAMLPEKTHEQIIDSICWDFAPQIKQTEKEVKFIPPFFLHPTRILIEDKDLEKYHPWIVTVANMHSKKGNRIWNFKHLTEDNIYIISTDCLIFKQSRDAYRYVGSVFARKYAEIEEKFESSNYRNTKKPTKINKLCADFDWAHWRGVVPFYKDETPIKIIRNLRQVDVALCKAGTKVKLLEYTGDFKPRVGRHTSKYISKVKYNNKSYYILTNLLVSQQDWQSIKDMNIWWANFTREESPSTPQPAAE